jgi:hypothetical protein
VIDPKLTSILRRISAAGPGPDAPLFSQSDMSKLAACPSAEEGLLQLIGDSCCDETIRFLAAEALVEGNWSAWRSDANNRQALADVLAHTLANDRTHNRWGLPGAFVGPFGRRLLSLGAEAQSALDVFLSDDRPLHITGSEAATLNSQARYRVADLASWLIATARHIPWQPAIGHNPARPKS